MSAAAVAVARPWSEIEVRIASRPQCTRCGGRGFPWREFRDPRPCDCVLREIFRACQRRFAEFQSVGPALGHERRGEEYMADFALVAQRALEHRPELLGLFRFYVLVGAHWEKCADRLGLDRGRFWHAVYRMERLLGRAYRDAGLYPVGDYLAKRHEKR